MNNKDKARAYIKHFIYDPIQFWILIIIIAVHWSIICIFHLNPKIVNKFIGLGLQIIGGFFIMKIINENIELFKHISLIGIFFNWVKSCPKFDNQFKINGQGSIQLQDVSLDAFGIAKNKCNTVDELQEELYRQIDLTRKFVIERDKVLSVHINAVEDNLKGTIDKDRQEIQEVKDLASESAIGSYKWEILGVLLVIYGAIIAIF